MAEECLDSDPIGITIMSVSLDQSSSSERDSMLSETFSEDSQSSSDESQSSAGNQLILAKYIRDTDVVLGRGKFANNLPGNCVYRRLLEQYSDAYALCQQQSDKTRFTRRIMQQIRLSGRFLKKVKKANAFVEISDTRARVKVGQVSLPKM